VEKAPFPLQEQERQPACSLRSATVYKIEKALCFAAPGATRIGRNAADRAGEHVAVLEINSPDRDGAPVLARPSWMVFLHGGVQLPGDALARTCMPRSCLKRQLIEALWVVGASGHVACGSWLVEITGHIFTCAVRSR
jgi:hypothetical protein